MKTKQVASVVAALALLVACEKPKVVADIGADATGHSAPTQYTIRANENVRQALPFSDRQDYEDARRGFIGKEPQLNIVAEVGTTIWKPSEYDFIEGDSGWIIVDPLTTRQTAAAAMALVRKHLGDKPVVAVIFTHSHGDHFAGVLGVVSDEEYRQGDLRVIAPAGFTAEATSENIIAGAAMRRRAMFMYGKELARTERGHIDSGLGKSPAAGTYGILEPTETIGKTPDVVTIDGLSFVFQYAPESEAPAELTFYLPELKAYCGAKVRDALKWSGYIDEMIDLSADAEVYLASHHWPVWGPENIRDFLVEQRDTYKFIHDQTVRLFSAGLTPSERADGVQLRVGISFSDLNEHYILSVTNSVLHHHRTESTSDSDVSLVLTRSLFVRVMTGAAGLRESLAAGDATIDGAASDLAHFFSLLDRPDGWFNIVTP